MKIPLPKSGEILKQRTTRDELGRYISTELNFLRITEIKNWDAFSDLFGDLFTKLPPKDYVYRQDDDWGWHDYDDYIGFIDMHKNIGPKNEKGEKDDVTLIFRNFYPFLKKNPKLQ